MKNDPLKFSLHLDAKNPDHVKVAEYLNTLGRKKSAVIVEALLRYMESGVPVVAPRAPALTREQVKQIVLDVLRKNGSVIQTASSTRTVGAHIEQNALTASSREKAAEVAAKDSAKTQDRPAGNTTENAKKAIDLDDTALDQINDALEMFGKM